jgi:hypothetical protein
MGTKILGVCLVMSVLALAGCDWPDTVRHTLSRDSGMNDTAYAYGLGPWQVATHFTSADVSPWVGERIRSVRVFISTVPTSISVQVYKGGVAAPTLPAVVDQVVSADYLDDFSWNEIVLDNPPTIAGDDYWIAVSESGSGKTVFGADAGPANAEGDWWNLNGGGWVQSGENRNWNLRAIVSD